MAKGGRSIIQTCISGSKPEVLQTRMAATAPSALNTFSDGLPCTLKSFWLLDLPKENPMQS